MTAVAVAGAAFAGAVCRHVVDVAVSRRSGAGWPLGTLVVNASGSAALSLVVGLGLDHGVADTPRTIVATGFLGAYTTFSSPRSARDRPPPGGRRDRPRTVQRRRPDRARPGRRRGRALATM